MLGLKPQKVQIDPDDLYNSDFELSYTFLKYRPSKFVKFPYIDHNDDGFWNSSVSSSTFIEIQHLQWPVSHSVSPPVIGISSQSIMKPISQTNQQRIVDVKQNWAEQLRVTARKQHAHLRVFSETCAVSPWSLIRSCWPKVISTIPFPHLQI